MPILSIQSPAEQVAAHLRDGIRRGLWQNEMPGAPRLARELGVDAKTVLAALDLLEHEGLLESRGVGRRRGIVSAAVGKSTAALRIGILLSEQTDRRVDYLGEVQHGLVEAGHHAFFAAKAQLDFGSDVSRLGRIVKTEKADAWVVVSGAHDVLQWFSSRDFPAFALFGRFSGLPIAAVLPEKIPCYEEAMDRLVALGHRRIALLARKSRRLPIPGRTERAFLQRLEYHGITTSPFNLPDWEDDMNGFQTLLEKLFEVTPPTALVIQEAFLFSAAHHFLTRRGLRVPDDVSMVCTDDDSSFAWWEPPVSRMRWDSQPVVRRVVNWAAKVSRGKEDKRQTFTKTEFVNGGTIARAR
jgi:DNA-binding LacI/PurR family transcriptional regulator